MSQSLFTSQIPTGGFNDGSPGITTSTTMKFAVAGTITAIRFYVVNPFNGGTWTGLAWEVTNTDAGGAGAGTLLGNKAFSGTPTVDAWNLIVLDTPISVVTNKLYRIGMHNDSRYCLTNNFFNGVDLINGDITAFRSGADPLGNGWSIFQGAFVISATTTAYPTQVSGTPAAYFVDVVFEPSASDVTLAADLTATGSMSAALTAERPVSAAFTATGSMTAALTPERLTAASLIATGSMTAALTNEVHLSAALTATAGMSVSAVAETSLRAALTATAGMSAALTIPTTGPVDPIATPVANQLLACLTEQMQTLPSPPSRIQLRVGSETGPLIGPNVDECCAGLAWVRVADVYPSWDSFPGPDNTWLPCGPLAYAVVLEMGSAFCMPWSDSEDTFDNIDPPSTSDWQTAFTTLMQHQTLMRRAAACCFLPTQRRAVGEWAPLSVEGGCTGGTLRVTVSVMAPCGDC